MCHRTARRLPLPFTLPHAVALAFTTACGDARGTAPEPPRDERAFPGFDTSIYPGDAAMRAWMRPGSPYVWSGYYLPAPCHRDTTWVGKRQRLADMGWGVAVIYVGQQTWEGEAFGAVTCSRTLLSAAQGRSEAADAVARTTGEGFPPGTVIFLDLEYMTNVPPAMRDYYRAWMAGVLADGRFRPGVYVHTRNAPEVYADVRAAFTEAGRADQPEVWVASSTGFSLERDPRDVGHAFATVWQGRLDVTERWSGVAIRIDANVARSPSPSAPPSSAAGVAMQSQTAR
jgi:hypothetical protein